jgi:putative addiction module component (TIGR02574 family)
VSIDSSAADFVVQEALKLPVPERVDVLNRLWQSLPPDSGAALLSEEVLEEIERRVAYEDAHPDEEELTWEQVKAAVPRKR